MAGLVKGLFGSLWKFGLFLAVLLGVLAFLAQGIGDTSLEEFRVTGLQEVSTESFTFEGVLVVDNPSLLPVPVRDVSYDLFHEDGERFSSGELDSFVLSPGSSDVSFAERVEWVPSAQLATDLLVSDEVWVTVNGTARVNVPFLREVDLPFEDRFDVREYVSQFATGAGSQVVDDVSEGVVDDVVAEDDSGSGGLVDGVLG